MKKTKIEVTKQMQIGEILKLNPNVKSKSLAEYVYVGLHMLAETSNCGPVAVIAALAPKTPKSSKDKSQLLPSQPPVHIVKLPPIENREAETGLSVDSVAISGPLTLCAGVNTKNCS